MARSLRSPGWPALRLPLGGWILPAGLLPTAFNGVQTDPLVLDNPIGDIHPASRGKDLLPVYAFNAEGLYLPGKNGGQRSSDPKRLSRWQDVLKKMQAEGFDIGDG